MDSSELSATPRPACRECRARKVRCDRDGSRCGPCTRLQLGCSYAPRPRSPSTLPGDSDMAASAPSSARVTQAGLARRRSRRACDTCRLLKTRCSGTQPCSRCRQRSLACVFPPGTAASPAAADDASCPSPTTTTPPPRTSLARLTANPLQVQADIRAYFGSLSASPASIRFLHRATVLADYSQGRLDPILTATLCALGRLYTLEHSQVHVRRAEQEDAEAWLAEARRRVVEDVATATIARVQTLILILQYRVKQGSVMDAWTLVALGARLAFTLRLNYELPGLHQDPITQETHRRMIWAIWLVDKLLAGGIEDLVVCATERVHVRLPCDDYTFERGIPSRAGWLGQNVESSPSDDLALDALGFYVRDMDCRHRILNYTKTVVRQGTSPINSAGELNSLQAQLTALQRALPHDLQLTPARLRLKAHSHDLGIYVALHMAWNQSHCNLYRLLVPGMREAVADDAIKATPHEFVVHCQTACLLAAMRIASLLAHLYRAGLRRTLAIPNLIVGIYQISQIVHNLRYLLVQE
ncbi:uncharacterized protein B0I36DRAFT_239913, partial [Microdochium trichocladiopsis]